MKLNYPYFWQSNFIISYMMIPFSWIFRLLTHIRKRKATPTRIGKFVICVGNLTVGGTGKTQVIKWLAKYCREEKIKFVIVTKAYGTKLTGAIEVTNKHTAAEVGDESIELLTAGKVIASPNILNAIELIDAIGANIVLVDDGLQNPNFIKDMSVVTIDPVRGVGNGRIIPAGPLRENPVIGITKADIVISVGNQMIQSFELTRKIMMLDKPFFKAAIKSSVKIDKKKQYVAFCGLGNPDKFFSFLKTEGLSIIEQMSFPDHHAYNESDLNKLKDLAFEMNAVLLTTRKDYVKLPRHDNIQVLDVDLDFLEHEGKIRQLLHDKLQSNLG